MKQRHVLSLIAVSALLALGGCLNQEKGEIAAVIRTDPSPPEGEYPLVVTFDGRSSVGNVALYIWDFGDGSPLASGEVVHHTYTDPGEYRASLTVREESGREDRAEVVVRVHSKLPVVDELSVDRNVVNANQPVYFYATAHDPDGEVRLFHWDFGDGSPEVTTPSGTVNREFLGMGGQPPGHEPHRRRIPQRFGQGFVGGDTPRRDLGEEIPQSPFDVRYLRYSHPILGSDREDIRQCLSPMAPRGRHSYPRPGR